GRVEPPSSLPQITTISITEVAGRVVVAVIARRKGWCGRVIVGTGIEISRVIEHRCCIARPRICEPRRRRIGQRVASAREDLRRRHRRHIWHGRRKSEVGTKRLGLYHAWPQTEPGREQYKNEHRPGTESMHRGNS